MNQQQQKSSDKKNYKEMADERKKKQIENVWNQVQNQEELNHIVKLRNKLAQTNKLRQETNQMISEMKDDYTELKKNIKFFIRKQNNTSSKTTAPKKEKLRKK